VTQNERLLPWLEARPLGATFKEINEFLAESYRMTRKRMQQLRKIGAIAHTNQNPRFLSWYSPEHEATARKESQRIEENRRRRAVTKKKARNRNRMAESRAEAWLEKTPAKVIVHASNAPPLHTKAAASVWEWRP
jgi:uncharacterized protein YlbG (UPF0298 family)